MKMMNENVAVDHYSIQWEGFHSNIIRALEDLLSVEEFVDVTLSCEGRTFKGHKVILSAGSTYFRKILKENPCRHPVLILNDIQVDILDYLMTYIYHGTVSIPHDKLQEFLRSAEAFKIKGIVDAFKPSNQHCERDTTSNQNAQILNKESNSFDTCSSSSHTDDLRLLASAATNNQFSKGNRSQSELLPPLQTPSPVNTTLTNHSTANNLANHSSANILTNHNKVNGLTNHNRVNGLTNHSTVNGFNNHSTANGVTASGVTASSLTASGVTASRLTASRVTPSSLTASGVTASAALAASGVTSSRLTASGVTASESVTAAIIASTASKRRKTMPRKLGSFMSSPARTPFSSGEEDSNICSGDTEKENLKISASLSTNIKLNRDWLPGSGGLNLAGLIKQEQDFNKNSSVNNNELASDLVNNISSANSVNSATTARGSTGINLGSSLISNSAIIDGDRVKNRTSRVLNNQGEREDEEKAMNLSTSSENSSQQEDKCKKDIFCLQSGQSTTTNTNNSMVSQAMQLLPSQLLNPATLKDLDKSTTDQMSALLGADQMAALLGPLWKSRQPRMCHYCNRMFSNKFNLKQHILNMHTQGREMQCEICNKKVKNKWYLRRHHVTHHNAPLKK